MTTLTRLVMVTLTLTLCACVSSGFLRNLKHRNFVSRKHNSVSKRQDESEDTGPKLFFKGRALRPVTRITRRHTVVLECEAGGSPGPTIHWLKNGERIEQSPYHEFHDDEAAYEDTVGIDGLPLLRLSTTRSKLVIDCVGPELHKAKFTCVAQTPYEKLYQSTEIRILSKEKGSFDTCEEKQTETNPHVYLWTATRVEFQDNKVQLFCRAAGSPRPEITWYDAEGLPISNGEKYQVLDNGDLIIDGISWFDMGVYTCTAENKLGEDTVDTFLYPTFRDELDGEDMLPPV